MTARAPQAPQAPLLTAEDRCDGCGAPARAFVLLTNGSELLFCGHHARRHRDALQAAGMFFVAADRSDRDGEADF